MNDRNWQDLFREITADLEELGKRFMERDTDLQELEQAVEEAESYNSEVTDALRTARDLITDLSI